MGTLHWDRIETAAEVGDIFADMEHGVSPYTNIETFIAGVGRVVCETRLHMPNVPVIHEFGGDGLAVGDVLDELSIELEPEQDDVEKKNLYGRVEFLRQCMPDRDDAGDVHISEDEAGFLVWRM